MPVITAVPPADFPRVRHEVEQLDAKASAGSGHTALGDAIWRDLSAPTADSAGFLARDLATSEVMGYVHVTRSDNFAPRHWVVGLVAPDLDDTTARALLDDAVGHTQGRGGGTIVVWLFGADERAERIPAAAGFAKSRDLYEMRVTLPLGAQPNWAPGVHVREFEVGRDEKAWLEVNNRAFANHPEQGAWIEATLRRRMAEPWFDPGLFLLAFDTHGLAGFNWLKLHREGHALLGEIFVIGVDPRAQGTGLGRALAIAGLARVTDRGAATGVLFCAAENAPALALYHSLGFTVHRLDRAYERHVAPHTP